MVSNCANPACNRQLHYLRDGKVFLFSRKNAKNSPKLLPRLEHFWLCGTCAKRWTLSMDGENNVTLVETKRRRVRTSHAAPSVVAAS